MNLSHYQPMDPDVNCRKSKKRVKACGKALPTHDSAAILLLEPGKGALRLKAWDGFFARSPPVFFRLPDPLRDLRPDPALAELLPQRLRIIAFICGNDFEAFARAPPFARTDLDGIKQREHLRSLVPVGWRGPVGEGHPVSLREAVDENAFALASVG